MSRPKYFIKTEVMVYGGRTKYYIVKGFSDDDQIAKVGSERDATKLCEEFERLTNEIANLRSQFANSEWKPIETAPKDGTKVLVYDESYGLPQKAWFGKDHFKEEYEGWLFGDGDDYSCGLYFTPIEPTHWMPLPKPPTK